MKRILFVSLCILCLCGCNNNQNEIQQNYENLKSKYDELEKQYNNIISDYEVSNEKEYLKKYFDTFNVQTSQMGKSKILEVFVDYSNSNLEENHFKIIGDISKEDWFNYDYIIFYAHGYGTIVGMTQFDNYGKIVSTMIRQTE